MNFSKTKVHYNKTDLLKFELILVWFYSQKKLPIIIFSALLCFKEMALSFTIPGLRLYWWMEN